MKHKLDLKVWLSRAKIVFGLNQVEDLGLNLGL